MIVRTFGISLIVTVLALVVAFFYGGWQGLFVAAVLGVLEVSLSFDNAVINATILERMSRFWQQMFLTVGVLIAVFGMRLIFPLAIVWVTAGLNPAEAFRLATNPPADGAATFPDGSPSYETILTDAHPQIAAFGGVFLLMLFLNFVLTQRHTVWLTWLERPLGAAGRLDQLSVVLTSITLLLVAVTLSDRTVTTTVLIAGLLGMITFIVIDGASSLFHPTDDPGTGATVKAAGKAGLLLFLYLEVLDATFSFDGVIGAFAITSDPILIALGLGFIGAMFVRSITIFLVRQGTLSQYRYLEHGAHWAIGALALILLLSIHVHVNEVLTGLVGVAFIGAALISSITANRRDRRLGADETAGDQSVVGS